MDGVKRTYIIVLALFFFSPNIELAGLSLRPEMMLIVLLRLSLYNKVSFSKNILSLLLVILPFCLISIILSYILEFTRFNLKDFQILFQIVLYSFYIESFLVLFRSLPLESIISPVKRFTVIVALIGISQRNNILGLNELIANVYGIQGAFNKFEIGIDYSSVFRVPGLIGDSRHFGLVLLIGCAAALTHIYKLSLKLIIYLAIILTAILFTGSKNALIGYAILLTVWSFFEGKPYLVYSFWIIILLPMYFFVVDSGDMELRALSLDSYSGHTVNARIRDNFEFFDRVAKDPVLLFFGMGPAKNVLPGSEHSEFGWWLIRYGILGFVLYFRFLYILIFSGITTVFSMSRGMSFINVIYPLLLFQYMFSESIFKLPLLFEGMVLMSLVLVKFRPK